MKDVAREAGVALGTVSKVFNSIPVGEDYRKRVEEAARRLGYQVNSYARGLKTNRTCSAALILPDITNPFFSALAQGVCSALAARGYRTILSITAYDQSAEQRCIQMVQQNKVDGIIGLTYNPELEIDPRLPYVSIDRTFSYSVPCVASDNFGGGQLAAEKLLELGCTRPLFLRIGSRVSGESDKRGDGFESVFRQRGMECAALRLSDEDGLAPVRDFLAGHMDGGRLAFDGIFCVNDALAVHVRNFLAELGLRVPEDVQLIGFDGLRHFATGDFYCSTIVQPVGQLAETSVDMLLREDRSNLPRLVCLPVAYAPGGTTKE
ncbi:MAG: LacI family DNA-binding transcriptional regulator [Oscillospiraceae bacterium]|nr:LacI family DNA-binding transcriptional regulator [Oscillospiraceae bacterium]